MVVHSRSKCNITPTVCFNEAGETAEARFEAAQLGYALRRRLKHSELEAPISEVSFDFVIDV